MRHALRLSVGIPSYGRPYALKVAMRSLLDCDHDSFELIVVDQNKSNELEEFDGDERIRILRVEKTRVGAARNLGTTAEQGWIQAIEECFARDRELGIVLGSVVAGEHDPEQGFVPTCTRHTERLHRQFADCPEIEVMAASQAIRKRTWNRLGDFGRKSIEYRQVGA